MSSNVNSSSTAGHLRRWAIWFAVCFLAFIITGAIDAQVVRPELYGFCPGYPTAMPDSSLASPVDKDVLPWESRLVFDIDSSGLVTGLVADSTIDSAAFFPIRERLMAMTFHPGIADGQPRAHKLSARLVRYPRARTFGLRLPLDTAGQLVDQELFVASAQASGFVPATIKQFPTYYSVFYRGDTLSLYPYVLVKLRLDTLGRVREVEVDHSTHPAFTQHIVSAANWAKFVPARAAGKAVPSTNWLLVSFFPLGRYPAPVITPKNRSAKPLLEQLGVRMFADTLGLLSGPVPRGISELRVTVPAVTKAQHGVVGVLLMVDTLGQGHIAQVSETRSALMKDLWETLKTLRFYPAIDFDGRRRDFTGFATFQFDGSTEIRIELGWLPRVPIPDKKVTTK